MNLLRFTTFKHFQGWWTLKYKIEEMFVFIPGEIQASRAELMVMTVSEIIKQLINAHEKGENVNLNKLVSLLDL